MELHQMSSMKMKGPEERRYSLPHGQSPIPIAASEDLHAWSIYRQNLNSDFTDSALGSSDKSPLPYGNFQLRDTTVQSILNHPRYGPKSPLGSNMYTYLKFGLPRVFPPNNDSQRSSHHVVNRNNRGNINRGYRNSSVQGFSGNGGGSSGYDSSDNETTKARQPQNLRKFRSESDFRLLAGGHNTSRPSSRTHGHMGNVSAAALRKPNSRASIAGTQMNSYLEGRHYGHRSHSEADLLSNDHNRLEYDTRNDIDLRNGSHEYTLSRNQNRGLAYPNIMVQALKISSTLRGVSLFAKAGDLFAVMATSHSEGTALMETLAGLRERLSGEIAVNGQSVTKRNLRRICSYVPAPSSSSLDSRMNVQSTLYFHASLCGPEDRSDLEEKINILVEDLGLSAVRTSNVSHLTHSEKQRLSVACQLLTKASILILDQATTNMDIFDTFFLVEYLRQWCNSGKIVIMTLQPPTFEILSMCSGVLLLSGGRTIFSGSRSNLPLHMGSLGYPCPPFKNPADYYLDLVTLDDLSAAAMIESSARINVLANSWEHDNVEPPFPPPAALPIFIKRAGLVEQSIALTKRFVAYKQPESILTWISKLIAAAILSLCIGFIFWDIPASDPKLDLNDRLGYHHCIMAIGFWPLILMNIREIQMDSKFAEKHIDLTLYGRTVYIVTQCILNFAPSLFIWLAYLLPAHSMAGLYSYTVNNDTDIYLYIGYMLLYFVVIQSITLLCSHLFTTSTMSAAISVIIIYLTTSVGGYLIHIQNIPFYWKWMEYVSPERWIYPVLLVNEFSHDTLTNSATQQLCRNRQVQHQEIIIQHPCPVPNGTAVLLETNLHQSFHIFDPNNIEWTTLIFLIVASVLLFILVCFAFIFNCRRKDKEK